MISSYKVKQFFIAICVFGFISNANALTIYGFFSEVTSTATDTPIQIGIEPSPLTDHPNCFVDNQDPANASDNQIRYGTGTFGSSGNNLGPCPGNQSGLGYEQTTFDFVCPQPGSSSSIEFGTFTHYNNPIFSGGDSLTGGTLSIFADSDTNHSNGGFIALPPTTFTFEETSNNPNNFPNNQCPYNSPLINPNTGQPYPTGPNCNDQVVIQSIPSNGAFLTDINGDTCELVVTGFGACGGGTTTDPETEFVTLEGTNNEACLFAQLAETVPVSLSSISSERIGNKVSVDWSTSSELFNVGYQLWGLDGASGEWVKLHNWLLRSGSGNAVEPQSYTKTVTIPSSISSLASIGLSSVDSDGEEHYYGPFEVGQSYGDVSSLEPIAWNHVRDEADAAMAAKGYVKYGHRGYRKASTAGSEAEAVAEFTVSESGMHRITSGELQVSGLDWSGVHRNDIAVVDALGNPVLRYIRSSGDNQGTLGGLGSNGEIIFYATAPDESAGLYTSSSVYRLVLDRNQVLNTVNQGRTGLSDGFVSEYIESSRVESDDVYVFTSAADDPWVNRVLVSYSEMPMMSGMYIPVEADAILSAGSTLVMDLGRSSGLRSVDVDGDGETDAEHIVEGVVLSDGELVSLGEQTANGSGEWQVSYAVPGGVIQNVSNDQVLVGGGFKAGSGYAFSEIHIDAMGLDYVRPLVSKSGDNHIEFSAPDRLNDVGYQVQVPDIGYPWVFASDGMNVVRILPESVERLTLADGTKMREVRFAALRGAGLSDHPLRYWVSNRSQMHGVDSLVSHDVASATDLLAQGSSANYLLVAHPAFMGTDSSSGRDYLSEYRSFKQSEGHSVALINYLDVVDAFGGGQPGPLGLTKYLSLLEAQGTDIENVLIVGGSTYDHTGILDSGAVTFIPGHYAQSDYSNFTVSDVPYVTDHQGELFASIGRWPVRSMSDVGAIVDKSMLWSTIDHSTASVLAIAENTLAGENIDFSQSMDSVLSGLPSGFSTTRVYVDDILDANAGMTQVQALSQAKGEIMAGLNADPDLVMYNGHASTRQLSNNGLFKAEDIAQNTSTGPQVWLPMSCYVTFYESTHVNTLAHQLMFTGNAAAIGGPALLTDPRMGVDMGKHMASSVFQKGQQLGYAMKKFMDSSDDVRFNQNWTLLGDPTLSGDEVEADPVELVQHVSEELM